MQVSPARKFYPRAWENRLPVSHPDIRAIRGKFFRAALINFWLILLLFFGLFCYLFASLYHEGRRTHNLNVLWVDFDGGVIGEAVRNAYQKLKSDGFPNLIERSTRDFPLEKDVKKAVCKTDYWAALYTSPGASGRLSLAISGVNASRYNASDALSFIWNEAKYPTIVDSLISSNLHTLADAARVAYVALNGSWALSTLPPNNGPALSAFANPWTLSSVDIKPTAQGTRTVYNTIVIVLVLIQDFFFLATLNALYGEFKVYMRISPLRIILVRDIISILFTMLGSLLLTCAIWAFRDGWSVSGSQFALTWLILWLFAHVNFLMLDIFTIWLPVQFVPMALITWVVINVTSIILPFALSPSFYYWGYALPAHNVYEALIDIWSSGCNPHLHRALPILFAYEVNGIFWTALGVYKRCHGAVIIEETNKEAMRMRIETALRIEREGEEHRLGEERSEKSAQDDEAGTSSAADRQIGNMEEESPSRRRAGDDRAQIENDLEDVTSRIERMETRARRMADTGPSFYLVGSRSE
ncbi:unnamed protein product [Clonostachys rhizophaga]|uniref:DUF3533 domain-containing protein n=1 Tax=Clonostachys rhizophaga TaxID=160324 RepID=A0A9N9VLK6_9HYPO|nr:unnamed protein product [Clonostachys rhizophaga]